MSRRHRRLDVFAALVLGVPLAACGVDADAGTGAGDESGATHEPTVDAVVEPAGDPAVLAEARVEPQFTDEIPVDGEDVPAELAAHHAGHEHAAGPGALARAGGALCVAPRVDFGVERLASDVADFPTFESPRCAFNPSSNCALATFDVAAAEDFLAGLKAKMPLYLPYTRGDVGLWQGWIYNSGGSHRGQDYGRTDTITEGEDPTFEVRAVAPGIVRTIRYGAGGGNIVGVEHTAPDGTNYYTYYMHLRDGRATDLWRAKNDASILAKIADGDAGCTEYKKFAEDFSDHASWGTNAQVLGVEIGDVLATGEFIGWAGNTGCGGASAGLNADGSPKSHSGNVHLHTYWGVEHPTKANVAVQFDPYGVYEEASTGCYELLETTAFRRFIAPFYPTFHNLELALLDFYFDYYPDMGRGLRTWHFDNDAGGKVRAAGSFQTGVGAFIARGWQTWDAYQDSFVTYSAAGYRPREISVALDAGGQRRVTSIWQAKKPGETIVNVSAIPQASWPTYWDSWTGAGRRVYNHFGYRYNGQNYHAAGATSDWDGGFKLFSDRTSAEMDAKVDEQIALGWAPDAVTINEYGATTLLSGIFRKTPGCWKVRWGMTSAQYQSYVSAESGKGYRLHKVQSYDDVTRYLVILTRSAPANGGCP